MFNKIISDVSDPAKGCKPAEVPKAPGGFSFVFSSSGMLPLHREDKMRRFKDKCAHFSFDKGPIHTHKVQVPNLALTHTKPDNSVVVSDSEVWLGSFSLYFPTYTVSKRKANDKKLIIYYCINL
jgi:hypothetical protein